MAKPGQRLAQYGYLGLVIGFFGYLYLYAGNWDYYYSGVWGNEDQLAQLFSPGFKIAGQVIPIPKLIAAPLTLGLFAGITYAICTQLEKAYKVYLKSTRKVVSDEQAVHQVFSVVTVIAFNVFFLFGWRPLINKLPDTIPVNIAFTLFIALVSGLWLYRTWNRSAEQYLQERLANKLKISHLECSEFLKGYCLDRLQPPDEISVLVTELRGFPQFQFQVYKGMLREALQERRVAPSDCLKEYKVMRRKLSLSSDAHNQALTQLASENPHLFAPLHQPTPIDFDRTEQGTIESRKPESDRTFR